MATDYARKVLTTSRASVQGQSRIKFIVLALLIVILAGGVSLLAYKKPWTALHGDMSIKTWLATLVTKPHKTHVKPTESAPKAALPTEPHFNFYTELPTMQVTLPDATVAQPPIAQPLAAPNPSKYKVPALPSKPVKISPTPIKNPRPATTPSKQYMLQIGAFKDASSANHLKSQLLSSGVSAQIVKVVIDKRVVYRVQQGPYPRFDLAVATQERLRKQGTASVIRKADD